MNKYLKLIEANTNYAKNMDRLSRSIFGDVTPETSHFGVKVRNKLAQKPYYKDEFVVNYYPRYPQMNALMENLRKYGLYRNEYQDFKDEMERLRVLKGKVKDRKDRAE